MAVSPYWLTELALTDVLSEQGKTLLSITLFAHSEGREDHGGSGHWLRVQVVADYVKLPEGLPLR